MKLNRTITCDNCNETIGYVHDNVVFTCPIVRIICNNCNAYFDVVTLAGIFEALTATTSKELPKLVLNITKKY